MQLLEPKQGGSGKEVEGTDWVMLAGRCFAGEEGKQEISTVILRWNV